jgi:raffinose/stachyose/melibiose transport system permease protein
MRRLPIVVVLVLVYLFPLLYLVNTALKTPEQYFRDPIGLVDEFSLRNFADAWEQGGFSAYVANSVVYTFVCATLGTLLSVFIAFPIARGYIAGARWWMTVFVLSLFLPNALTAQFQLILNLGLYDTRLGYMLLMIGNVGVGPLLIVSYLRGIPRELDEAAGADGCGYFRYVVRFVIPLARPVLATVFILQAIGIWNDIIIATIYLADPDQQPISRGLFAFYGQYSDQGTLLAAATLIVALPLILVYAALQRVFVAGAISGAFKS